MYWNGHSWKKKKIKKPEKYTAMKVSLFSIFFVFLFVVTRLQNTSQLNQYIIRLDKNLKNLNFNRHELILNKCANKVKWIEIRQHTTKL